MVSFARVVALLVAGMFVVPLANAQQVHVLAVGDTSDEGSGADSIEDLTTVRRFFATVVDAGIPVDVTEVKGASFSCNNILSSVSNLKVGRNDAIVFYYSGHGKRTATTATKFPEFACDHFSGNASADLSGIVDRLNAKNPRLTIAIADTCNSDKRWTRARAPFQEMPLPPNVTLAMRHLFLEYRGTVVLSAAIPGQWAWGSGAGSYFTRQLFLQSIPRVIDANDGNIRPRWEAIIVDALRDIEVPSEPTPPAIQFPQVSTWGLAEQWPVTDGMGTNRP